MPQNDNVSLASFLKYMDVLGLTPDLEPAAAASKKAEAKSEPPVSPVEAMRKGLRAVK